MSATTKFRVFTVAAVSTLALIGSPAFAGTVLTEPATATGFVNGNGLTVTNQELYQGPGNPRPFAIKGLGSGNSAGGVWGAVNNTAGIGLYGTASSTNSFGVYGFNDGTGFGGYFLLGGTAPIATDSALEAVNSGGSKTTNGNYGNAGNFMITNAKNQSPGVAIVTNGINSYGLSVVNTGTTDGSVNYGPPFDIGDIAGYFAITKGNSSDSTAIYAVSSGGGGSAATFITSDPANTDDTLYAQTFAPDGTGVFGAISGTGGDGSGVEGADQTSTGGNGSAASFITSDPANPTQTLYVETFAPGGNAVYASVGGTGGGGYGLYGDDETSTGGTGVWGDSTHGVSGAFFGGGGGTNTCSYNGSASGWNCTTMAAMMDDRTAPDYAGLLDRLDAMPMAYFHTKGAKVPVRELGMSAEDFRAAFGLGPDDTTIAEGNAYGVALAAAKGLYQKLKADEATIAAADKRAAEQDSRIMALQHLLAQQQAALTAVQATVVRLAQPGIEMRQASLTEGRGSDAH